MFAYYQVHDQDPEDYLRNKHKLLKYIVYNLLTFMTYDVNINAVLLYHPEGNG